MCHRDDHGRHDLEFIAPGEPEVVALATELWPEHDQLSVVEVIELARRQLRADRTMALRASACEQVGSRA